MDLFQTIGNATAITVVGLVLARLTQGLRHEIKTEIREFRAEIRAELKGELGGLRSEFKGEIAELRAEMREMRSDLTRVALAVGAEPRAGRQ